MKNKLSAKIFCRNNEYGKLDFYLEVKGETMYLFTTDFYTHNIHNEYYNGKRLDEMFSKTSMVRQQKLKERIIRMVKFTAQEYELELFIKAKKPVYKEKVAVNYDYEVA